MNPADSPVNRRQFYRYDPYATIALLAGVFIFSQVIAALLVGLYPSLRNLTGPESTSWLNTVPVQFAYILAAEVSSIALMLQLLKRANIPRRRIGLVQPKALDVAYALSGYAIYFLAYMVIITVATTFIHDLNGDQKQQLGFDNPVGAMQLVLTFISLVILPPLAEEIMFRGFLFSSLRAKYRLRYAMLITSVLFGLAHLEFGNGAPLLWVAALDTFTLSCVLCYLREKSGSLVPPMLLHAIKNGIAFTVLYHIRF